MEIKSNNLHYIAVTCIIEKDGKVLICKRSEKEKVFGGKWCVPGGKLEVSDFIDDTPDTSSHWLNIFEKVLHRETLEEVGLLVKDIDYVSNLSFMRPNGYSTIIVSMFAKWSSGDVVLAEDELVEFAWVDLESAKDYDLIENIYEQIVVAYDKFEIN